MRHLLLLAAAVLSSAGVQEIHGDGHGLMWVSGCMVIAWWLLQDDEGTT